MDDTPSLKEWLAILESSSNNIDLQGSAYLREMMESLETIANNAECPFWRVARQSCMTINQRDNWCSICNAKKTWEELNADDNQ